jgi:hypothetical protein
LCATGIEEAELSGMAAEDIKILLKVMKVE